jgi:hypothetical protein
MPLAIVCSWLSCQRALGETHELPLSGDKCRRKTVATCPSTAFAQPPLGCDGRRPRWRRTAPLGFWPSRICPNAGDRHSWAVPAGRVLARFHLRLRRPRVWMRCRVREGHLHRMLRSPVIFGAGVHETELQIRARLLSVRRPMRAVHGCSSSPPPCSPSPALRATARVLSTTTHHAAASRIQSTFRRWVPLLRERRCRLPLSFEPPLVRRLCHQRRASDMRSRNAYCARPSPRATFPPRGVRATCRPSTSTSHDDPRARPWTFATSASGLASHRQPSDPPAR